MLPRFLRIWNKFPKILNLFLGKNLNSLQVPYPVFFATILHHYTHFFKIAYFFIN
eukprot:UN11689